MIRKARRNKWMDMEIARIKLNPEQAVLACCSQQAGRDEIHGTPIPRQCSATEFCGGTVADNTDVNS